MNYRALGISIGESVNFAMQSIRSNLLRTLLSLSGITIGVFCIIGILTLVDSIRNNVEESISRFGDKVVFIQKWPWLFESDYPWWKYVNRPELKYREMALLRKKLPEDAAVTYAVYIPGKKITTPATSAEDVTVAASSEGWDRVKDLQVEAGRVYSDEEAQRGAPVAMLGYELAVNLFGNPQSAADKTLEVFGRRVTVSGVLTKEGEGVGINSGQDRQIFLPYNFVRNFGSFEEMGYSPTIYVKGAAGQEMETFDDEIRGYMRSVRRLTPQEEDDFALNRITMISNVLDKVFAQINIFGWIIAGFSILVGGFGIANIMFVSVRERTHIIGIQKALGAPGYSIMVQFLGEAVMLCVFGGLVGLLLVFLLGALASVYAPFTITLTFKNVMIGIGLSSFIGILAGYIPSRQAARLDPIEAIRHKG